MDDVWRMLLHSHLLPASSLLRNPEKNISSEQRGKVGEEGIPSRGNSGQQQQESHVALEASWRPQGDFPHSSYMSSLENTHPP